MTASSSSSETSTAVLPDARNELIMMSLESTSSFFCSSPWTLVSPARPILGSGKPQSAIRLGVHAQVDEPRFPDVGGDELGGRLDRRQEQGEVSGGGMSDAELICKDVSGGGVSLRARCSRRRTHRVRVMMSVLGNCSVMAGCVAEEAVVWV